MSEALQEKVVIQEIWTCTHFWILRF